MQIINFKILDYPGFFILMATVYKELSTYSKIYSGTTHFVIYQLSRCSQFVLVSWLLIHISCTLYSHLQRMDKMN